MKGVNMIDWFDEDKELEKFIQKHNIVPTHQEKLILTLAILHGVIVYSDHQIKKLNGEI